ncbi:hypothetical protein D6D02_10541 [Aureobasidium pullulans]|nr:hypothetical protein D6D03_10736 [Aureobasidium pullulans]THX91823.1 hypothetical protein D6D02_10541 [Aureobasidium pullulans]
MLAAAPDPTLFSALSFSPCLAADISTHFCATNDDTSDIQALPRDLPLPSAIALLFLIPERQHALHHLYTGRLSIAPELLNSSYFKIWSDVCLSPPPQHLAFGGKRFPTSPRPHSTLLSHRQNRTCITPGWLCCCTSCTRERKHPRTPHHAQLPASAENSNNLTAGHFAHLLGETACSYDYTSQSSLPRLQSSRLSPLACCCCCCYHYSPDQAHLLLLQHLKTTLTTASNLRHSLLSPSSSSAGMRSLSFTVASLFVSALTLSSASTQIYLYIFKLKKLPDPLTPLFAAATTITAKEDLSLVYEFKRFSESSFGLQLSPLNFRCRSCRIPASLHC